MFFGSKENKKLISNTKLETILRIVIFALFVVYVLLIMKITLFKYASIGDIFTGRIGDFRSLNLNPFSTVKGFFDIAVEHSGYLWAFSNIIGNVLIMAPFGFCVPLLWQKMRSFKWTVIAVMIFSFAIELCQYAFSMGAADIDDFIMNTLGGMFGYLIYLLLKKLTKTRLILYIVTILIAVSAFVAGFAVAREQFGSLLGLVEYKTVSVGDENIPKTQADYHGTLVRWEENKLVIYNGLLSGADDPNIAYAEEVTLSVNEQTEFYFFTFDTEKYTTTVTYKLISQSEAEKLEVFSTAQIWLGGAGNIMTAVFTEPLQGQMITTTEIEPPQASPQDTGNPQASSAPESPNAEAVPSQSTDAQNASPETIEGSIEELSDGEIRIDLHHSQVLEDGSILGYTTGIMLAVKYTEDTVFTVKTIRNGGINPEDVETRPGSAQDLKTGVMAEFTGSRKGDVLEATDIVINEVVW